MKKLHINRLLAQMAAKNFGYNGEFKIQFIYHYVKDSL